MLSLQSALLLELIGVYWVSIKRARTFATDGAVRIVEVAETQVLFHPPRKLSLFIPLHNLGISLPMALFGCWVEGIAFARFGF